jgi:ArsR family transcriptional regulator, virulence genes transcriptional regulator
VHAKRCLALPCSPAATDAAPVTGRDALLGIDTHWDRSIIVYKRVDKTQLAGALPARRMEPTLDERVFELQADVCKVFSHPKRLQLLCLLKDGERSFGELQELSGLSKANLSQHLSLLRERGMVQARRQGQNLLLSVTNSKIITACQLMHEFVLEQASERHAIASR